MKNRKFFFPNLYKVENRRGSLNGGVLMSHKKVLIDMLEPGEVGKVLQLKEEMVKAPNKFEVNGIAHELFEMYELIIMRYKMKSQKNVADERTATLKKKSCDLIHDDRYWDSVSSL